MTIKSPRRKTRSASKGAEGGRHDQKCGAKGHRLVQLLRPRAGVDIAALSGKLGWQPHSTRAALSRLRQAGYAIEKLPPHKGGRTRYRISKAPRASAR
jgi:predicted ArsR family transcriptional regulator